MKVEQRVWLASRGWDPGGAGALRNSARLALVFGATSRLLDPERFREIERFYPEAQLFGCSTSGEICGTSVYDDSIVLTAIALERSHFKGATARLDEVGSSFEAGERLSRSLEKNGLKHVLVLSDGLKVNGSALVKGLASQLPASVTVTGGLAGDGERFRETLVFFGNQPQRGVVAVLGLYGDHVRVGYGSLGGWDPFGPERLITRSRGNVLYELDGRSALELYKGYLGEHARGLPATGLLFPLSLRTGEGDAGVVRTILAIDDADQSMTFAGDVPEGAFARLMKANFDRLIDGAVGAAKTSYEALGSSTPDLAVCISCVGRKLVLKQRTEEEVEGVRDVLGQGAALAGFYSYGEISPFTPNGKCELHNQTMTITTLSER